MPEWWDGYEVNPYGCSHPRSPHGRCIWHDCPKNSYTYKRCMSWWRAKETCNHKTEKTKEPPSCDECTLFNNPDDECLFYDIGATCIHQQALEVRELEAER